MTSLYFYMAMYIVSIIVGFCFTAFVLLLLDQYPDAKQVFLNGNPSSYLGKALAIWALSIFITFTVLTTIWIV